MIWVMARPQARPEMFGWINFLSEDDPRSAREQIDFNYVAGWHPFPGFEMAPNGDLFCPYDPSIKLLAEVKFRNETIRLYDSDWLAIMREDGTWEVSQVD